MYSLEVCGVYLLRQVRQGDQVGREHRDVRPHQDYRGHQDFRANQTVQAGLEVPKTRYKTIYCSLWADTQSMLCTKCL